MDDVYWSDPADQFGAVAGFVDALVAPPAWHADALCAEPTYAPAWWFSHKAHEVAQAKATCARCLVGAECLQRALQLGETDGIFGGLTAIERRQLQRAAS